MRRLDRTVVGSRHRRGAAIYMTVVGVSLLVAVLSLAALNLVRVERRTSELSSDLIQARLAALAAAEMAVRDVQRDLTWRTKYLHDVETSAVAIGEAAASWKLCDASDTSLADDATDAVIVKGIGRLGNSVWVESVTLEAVTEEVGPLEFKSYTGLLLVGEATVSSSNWYAEYFQPTLPEEAHSWRVSQVELMCQQASTSSSNNVTIGLRIPEANQTPSNTVVESVTLTANSLPTSYAWFPVACTSNSGLDPEVGVCLTLTSTTTGALKFKYDTLSIAESGTSMCTGTPTNWGTPTGLQTFLYKVQGYYTVCEMKVVERTWKRTSL